MSANGHNRTQLALVKAIRLICKPLIRLMIEKGVTFPQFRELMKELYVQVANESFSLEGKKQSDSRIFVLTGVHRKDIKRIRQMPVHGDQHISSAASLSGEIIARWTSMPEYLDKKGKPRPLPRNEVDGLPGFDQLVSGINKDVRPKVILDEWLRLNVVYIKDERVILKQSAFVTNKEFNEMAYYLGHNVHDHLASCVHNIMKEGDPMLERSVYYASLTERSIDKLRVIANRKGDELLQHINKQAIKLYDADRGSDEAMYRMRLGLYWYQDRLDDTEEPKQ